MVDAIIVFYDLGVILCPVVIIGKIYSLLPAEF